MEDRFKYTPGERQAQPVLKRVDAVAVDEPPMLVAMSSLQSHLQELSNRIDTLTEIGMRLGGVMPPIPEKFSDHDCVTPGNVRDQLNIHCRELYRLNMRLDDVINHFSKTIG